ncbi:MAG: NHL repeat-containing protein, partial [Candidatus Taylorbacteria bacterium]|nr:NHL repeat-containing protein [Candidatus Taylorbacteria bacterium]
AQNSTATFNNVTVANNIAGSWAGAYMNGSVGGLYSSSLSVISNSIIWGNSTINGVTSNLNAQSSSITYSDIVGWTGGTGNISLDPKFVSSTDFHLQSTSPAINTGDPSLTDPDGSRLDMGAYPFVGTIPTPTPSPLTISNVRAQNIGQFTADILWSTNKLSDSQVEFLGPCPSTGCLTPIDTNMTASHSVNIFNLSPSTSYPYQVKSRDSGGTLATSTTYSFKTLGTVTPTPTPIPGVLPPTLSYVSSITGLNDPAGIAVNPTTGEIYVADYGNDNVKVYASGSYNYIRTIGSTRGSSPGQFSGPWDIAFDSSGNAFITDTNNSRVQVFSPTGTFIKEFPSLAYQGIAVNSSETFYVSGRSIELFNRNGQKISDLSLGSNYYPRNIAIDKNNRIYFTNWGNSSSDSNNSFTIQDSNGNLIRKATLDYQPYFITIDSKFRIWVADYNGGRGRVYNSAGDLLSTWSFNTAFPGNVVGLEIHGNRLYVSSHITDEVRIILIDAYPY